MWGRKVSSMSEKTWLEIRKKRTRRYVFFFLVLAVAAAAVFVRNNRDMFFSSSRAAAKPEAIISVSDAPKDSAKETRITHQRTDANVPEKAVPLVQRQEEKKPPPPQVAAKTVTSVLLPGIQCTLRDRGALKVVISLELFLADTAFKREVLLKRENLKVMVQKVVASKTVEELVVDSLRSETKTTMNKLLEKNIIEDIEFRDFRIDKVK